MKALAAALCCTLALTTPAFSHNQWADGSPVPAWVKQACCGPNDAHMLDPAKVHGPIGIEEARRIVPGVNRPVWRGCAPEGGECILDDLMYVVEGYPYAIGYRSVLPSPDGRYWLFYTGTNGFPLCFFAPMAT